MYQLNVSPLFFMQNFYVTQIDITLYKMCPYDFLSPRVEKYYKKSNDWAFRWAYY